MNLFRWLKTAANVIGGGLFLTLFAVFVIGFLVLLALGVFVGRKVTGG